MSGPLSVMEFGDPSGTTVVLLHGAGTSGRMWERQAAQLASSFHVLVPDLPGHGSSAAVPWRSIEDAASQVADVVAARSRAGRAHVVGLSLGGYIALTMTTSHRSIVESTIASGVAVLPVPHPRLMHVLGALVEPLARTNLMIDMNARLLRIPIADRDDYRAAAKQVSRNTTRRVSVDAIRYRLPTATSDSSCPVLAVAGEREHRLILDSLPAISGYFPRGMSAIAPAGGHAWSAEHPELFTAMIRDWASRSGVAQGLASPVENFGSMS